MRDKKWWKDTLTAIFIGACVSFLTALLEGFADLLSGYANNVSGGVVSSVIYAVRRHIV